MNYIRLIVCSGLAAIALSLQAQAAPAIIVNGSASKEIAPPSGSLESDAESGAPLARTSVSVADELPGVWSYSALADIGVPKLAIFGAITNTSGDTLRGPFGGEVPLMRVNATLRDTINIVAPSPDPYIVTAEMDIDGLLEVSGTDGVVNAQFSITPLNKLSANKFATFNTDQTVVDFKLPISFQFTGDAQFDLSSSLFFFVSRVDAGAHVLADFSHTAIINIIVTTLAGDVIPDVVIESTSGNFGTTPVPVPPSLAMLGSALALLARLRRRR
ncbi:MAG: hypothetical protein IPM80_09835 [Proteobacteria bacterium]|nr:hypothetical protein [Pseudomonadota bacterium]